MHASYRIMNTSSLTLSLSFNSTSTVQPCHQVFENFQRARAFSSLILSLASVCFASDSSTFYSMNWDDRHSFHACLILYSNGELSFSSTVIIPPYSLLDVIYAYSTPLTHLFRSYIILTAHAHFCCPFSWFEAHVCDRAIAVCSLNSAGMEPKSSSILFDRCLIPCLVVRTCASLFLLSRLIH